ncbi:MAG: di-heme oxidoredictase family protein [Planctomycetota bacterium]|jgi:hypothetical protein
MNHLRKIFTPVLTLGLATIVTLLPTGSVEAQYGERPALVGSGDPAVDVSGRSIKNPRVRAIATTDTSLIGGTAWMFEQDPYLAFQLGRNLNFREFRTRDGVFHDGVSDLAGPMPDGATAKITAANQTSCAGCHNLPNGNPGGGPNFHKDSGFGRNTPHYYGAGIVEMLAIQIREEILLQVDLDNNGWISSLEAQTSPAEIEVPTGVGTKVRYGSPRLSAVATGTPQLNNVIRVWYVDADGVRVPGATQVDGVTTFGYNFEVVVWGWGQGEGRAALNPTNRAFTWDPLIAHSGLDAYDPASENDPDGDGVSEPTLAGAIQFPATHLPPDAGTTLDPLGFSRDDPDGDGYLNEISEGDLDLAEIYMLNIPRPAFRGTPDEFRRGVKLMEQLECATCHTPDWQIRPADTRFAGDRRFFDLDVQWNDQRGRLEGKVEPLYTRNGPAYERNLDAFEVKGFFSDLAHHEMGPDFAEIDFSGHVNSTWRTPPLWGLAHSAPYGHDGRSFTIEDAIRRHGGEALASRTLFENAPRPVRDQLLEFLSALSLYDIESLPTDVDGDGQIRSQHIVQGVDTGEERFNPEWLFRNPVEIQGMVTVNGRAIRSFAAVNLEEAYGLNLPYRIDSDLDGWPDVWDAAPLVPGYKDGVN